MTSATTIRFIRNLDHSSDDILTIRSRANRDDYLVRFTDSTYPNTVWVQSKTYSETMSHIERMLLLSTIDAIPYSHVQITVPGIPVFIFTPSSLTASVISDILTTIAHQLDDPVDSFIVTP